MSTTRGGETVSAQIGTIGPIEGLSTGNFKMEDTPFNIKNDGETAVVLEVNLCYVSSGEALDMQERLKIAFPKLLEIRRNNVRRIDNELEIETEDTLKSPYELICKFIPSLKDDEKELIKNVINEVMLKEGE